MKKAAIMAAAAVPYSGAALAQQVTVYDIIDRSVGRTTDVDAAAADSAT